MCPYKLKHRATMEASTRLKRMTRINGPESELSGSQIPAEFHDCLFCRFASRLFRVLALFEIKAPRMCNVEFLGCHCHRRLRVKSQSRAPYLDDVARNGSLGMS